MILVQDQGLYFFLWVVSLFLAAVFADLVSRVIMCSVFNILNGEFFATTSFEVSAVFEALGSPTLLCILGSRMLFNLKEAAEHGVNTGTNWSSYSHTTTIGFEERAGLTEDVECVFS